MLSRTESLELMAAALVGASIWFFRAERESRAQWQGRAPLFVRFAAWLALAKSLRAALQLGAWTLRGAQSLARAPGARTLGPYLLLHASVDLLSASLLFTASIAMLARRENARTVSTLAAGAAVLAGYLATLAAHIPTFRAGAALDAGAMGLAGTLAVPIEAAVVAAGGVAVSRAFARARPPRD